MRMPPSQKMANLFQQIDTSGSGSITKAQFEQAFQTMNPPPALKAEGADAVFAKLDPNGTGNVSKQDFVKGMTSMTSHIRSHHHHGGHMHASQGNSPTQTVSASLQSLNDLGGSTSPDSFATGTNVDIKA